MKYFLDTEFIEGLQQTKMLGFNVGESKPTIDLISIGIVSEDGREYYAVSKDFNLQEAWDRYDTSPTKKKTYWLRENVLKPIFIDLMIQDLDWNKEVLTKNLKGDYSSFDAYFTYRNFHKLIKTYGKHNSQIAKEILAFVYPNGLYNTEACEAKDLVTPNCSVSERPEFFAYYADYDWVVFCWLFGTMNDLPKGFPMYCRDLKHMLDDKANEMSTKIAYESGNHTVWSIDEAIEVIKSNASYPPQLDSHIAIEDARWDLAFYKFLQAL